MITDDPEIKKIDFVMCDEGHIKGNHFHLIDKRKMDLGFRYYVSGGCTDGRKDSQIAIADLLGLLNHMKEEVVNDIEKLKKLLIVEHQKAHKKA